MISKVQVVAICLLLMLRTTTGYRRGPHHPHGQEPVPHAHHHYKPRGSDALTRESDLLHDIKHIEEDSKVLTPEILANMSPEELEFHYFSSHDFDRNSKLDGLEMLKAVYHTIEDHANEASDADITYEPDSDDFAGFVELVDRTLSQDDLDNDGYVSYAEYRAAREKNPIERTPRVLIND